MSSLPAKKNATMSSVLFKVVLVGGVVGKTAFIKRYIHGALDKWPRFTIGVDFGLKEISWTKDCNIKLQLWDIAGQERFTKMASVYLRDTEAILFFVSLTRKESLEECAKWIECIKRDTTLLSESRVPCILLANMSDAVEQREISSEELKAFCVEHLIPDWFEISVKDGITIEKPMEMLIETLKEKHVEENGKFGKTIQGGKASKSSTLASRKTEVSLSEELLKVVVIGDICGKTTFVKRITNDTANRLGLSSRECYQKEIQRSGNCLVKLKLLDICSAVMCSSMTRVYYNGAHGCLIMLDLTQKMSLTNCIKWIEDLKQKSPLLSVSPAPCLLLANKCDDVENLKISRVELDHLCREYDLLGWVEVSAKDGVMVDEALDFLLEVMMSRYNTSSDGITEGSQESDSKNVRLNLKFLRCESTPCVNDESNDTIRTILKTKDLM